MHALEEYGVDARPALRGHHASRPCRDRPTTTRSSSTAAISCAPRRSRSSTTPSWTGARRCCSSAPAARSASTRCRPTRRVKSLDFEDHPFDRRDAGSGRAPCAAPRGVLPRRDHRGRQGRAACSCAPTPTTARAGAARRGRRRHEPQERPLLRVRGLTQAATARRSAASTWASTCGRARCSASSASRARARPPSSAVCARPGGADGGNGRSSRTREGTRWTSARCPRRRGVAWRAPTGASCTRTRATACGWAVTAGANVGERLMALGARHYGAHPRGRAGLARPGRDRRRPHRRPARRRSRAACSSGCRSRATSSRARASCSWTSRPAGSTSRCRRGCSTCCAGWWPTSGSPPSSSPTTSRWRACWPIGCSSCAAGEVVESGLTDQVLDDPQHPYTQLLVSSVLQP